MHAGGKLHVGVSRRAITIAIATFLVGAQSLAIGVAVAASPDGIRILYTPPSTIADGTPANFTAQITPYAAGRTVSWSVNGTVEQTDLTNPNGISQVSLNFSPGSYSVVATLEAGADWAEAVSDPFELTVTADPRESISVSISSDPNPVLRDDVTTVTVQFSPAADDGSVFLRVVGSGSGQLVDLHDTTSVDIPWWSRSTGTFLLEACFMGSDVFAPSCSPALEQVVFAYTTTTTLSISPNPDYPDGPLTLGIAVSPAPEVPVIVVVNDITPPTGGGRWNVPVGTDGLGQIVLTDLQVQAGLSVGHHTMAAFFPGTSHNDSSLSAPMDLEIHQDPSTTNLTLSSSTILAGDSFTLSVDVTPLPSAGTPVGVSIGGPIGFGDNVVIYLNGSGHGSTGWNSSGAPPGDYTFIATYGGTVRIGPSHDSESATITAIPMPTVLADAPSITIPETQIGTMSGTYADPDGLTIGLTASIGSIARTGTSAGTWTWTAPAIDGPWDGYVEIAATDTSLRSASAWFGVSVQNVAPVVTVVGPMAAIDTDEGTLRYTWSATDVAGDPVSMQSSDCGRGTKLGAGANWVDCRFDIGGPTTVSVVATDGDGGSGTGSMAVDVADTVAPTGSITIDGGLIGTSTVVASLTTPASDLGTGLAEIALSDDGVTWTTRAYDTVQSWTLPGGNGLRTVYAKWKDGAGNWSAPSSDTILLDTVAPLATAPAHALAVAPLASGKAPVRLTWTGSDATSGVGRYEIRRQSDHGAWSAPTIVNGTSSILSLSPGHTYRYGVRAVDNAGNVGAWAYGSSFKVSAVSQASSLVHYHGTWATSTSSGWWGGSAKSTSTRGSTASFTFTGRSIAWVGLKAATRGKAYVYVNGVLKATVNLYSATTLRQQIVWSANYATSAARTITIKVVGTSGRPRVDVDGFVVGS